MLLLALLSLYAVFHFGTLLVIMAIRGRAIHAMQFSLAAIPATYLVWYFFMRSM